jgi:cytochrome c553
MNRPAFLIGFPVILAIIAAAAAIFVANAQTTSKLNKVDTNVALWGIQPGLGTVMIEYNVRFGNAWWAGQAGNWDMATYQLNEMTEIQEVGETTRPARADALKKFEDENLTPLINAAKAKNQAQFNDAYDKAITGCNRCHGEQKDAAGNTFRFVSIMRPASQSPFSNVDWKGQQ